MQVERIRSFETDSGDPARTRGDGKSTGFSELMDSLLGSAGSERATRPEVADSGTEKPSSDRSSRDVRDAAVGARRSPRGEDRVAPGSEEAAARTQATEREEEVAEASAGEAGEEREDAATGERDGVLQSELFVAPGGPAIETAAPVAIPVFDAPERGSEVEADAEEGLVELAPALRPGDDASRSSSRGGLAAQEAGDLPEALNARAAIDDPRAREALRAALEQALAAGDARTAAVEGEGEDATGSPPELEAESLQPASVPTDRSTPRTEGAPRPELAAAFRMAAADRGDARSQSDLGEGDSGAGREAGSGRPAAEAAPKSSPESSAVAAAAIEGATAGLVEAVADTDDSGEAIRLDGAAPAVVARAPELPPTLQTARALPTAAPDAIAVQAEWLATRGGGTARLVLNPPELGEIAIRVTVRQQAVEVVMIAQTALAHSMAEDQGDRLSQAFASRELRLDQFEVRRGDPSDSNGTAQFGSSDAGARERDRAQDERGIDRRRGFGRGSGRSVGAGGVAAAPPRVGSNPNGAGIDLRI